MQQDLLGGIGAGCRGKKAFIEDTLMGSMLIYDHNSVRRLRHYICFVQLSSCYTKRIIGSWSSVFVHFDTCGWLHQLCERCL